ncbi:MAG: MFS transporter [Lachnospiraceae bacterium]|nr:MFS transporter [Lachnospiraceae bacterium]
MKFSTLRYTLINITYFMAFCTVHAYAAVYLLDRGFTNTQIGLLLAVANITSALAQPMVASLIDRQGMFTNRNVMIICAGIIAAGSALLLVADTNKILVFIVFALIYMIQFTYMPVMTALNFEYQNHGINIIYGLARGLGSAGFAITSALVGGIVEKEGVRILLYLNIVIMAVQIVIVYFFKLPKDAKTGENGKPDESVNDINSEEEASSLTAFLGKYPAFVLMLAGTVLIFFTHNMLNDYLIQIVRPLGGSEKHLGYATFIAAFLELPTMAAMTFFSKKLSMRVMLVISGIAFTVKALIMTLATNIPMVYISQSMQLLAYAVFIPASAYYVSQNISETDQVKGQAFVTSCFTLSGVFSSLLCGVILDHMGVKAMLVIGLIVSVAGAALLTRAMLSTKRAKEPSLLTRR